MNIQQLRAFCEIVRHGLHISAAAAALHSSQSAVSKQIHDLERELGTTILVRRRNHIVALSEPGKKLLLVAERIVNDAQAMRQIADDHSRTDEGRFILATTHTHARYTLPRAIGAFAAKYKRVAVGLKAGTPAECCRLLTEGHADIAITTQPDEPFDGLGCIPAYRLARCLVAPLGHPLLNLESIDLSDIAQYPLITYDLTFSSRRLLKQTFEDRHLNPMVALSAIDPEICKTYVALGVGVAILPRIAYDPVSDAKLGVRDLSGILQEGLVSVYVRRNAYLRQFVYEFISIFAPHLDSERIDQCMHNQPPEATPSEIPLAGN